MQEIKLLKEPAAETTNRDVFDEPRCYDILLNYNCSAKCLFCSQDFVWRKVPNDLPYAQAVEHVYRSYKNGYRRLGFTGGEPTLRQDLGRLIALARKVGFTYIRIQTNGIRLADFNYAKNLMDAGLNFVKFSIHGHNAEIHDRLVTIPGAFDKCLQAIENLKKLKVGMGVNIVLNGWNYKHLVEFYELFLLKLGLSNFVIIYPLYEGNMTNNVSKIGIPISQVASYIKKAYRVFTKINFPKPPLLLHFTPCVLPGYEQQMLGWSNFNTMVVSPRGESRDLDETAAHNKVKTEECQKCVYNDRCLGFEKTYVDVFGTKEIKALKKTPARYDAKRAAPDTKRRVLTDNEQCVLEVLGGKNNLSTQEFLKRAHTIPLCKDCRDENAVVVAAETLIRMGLIEKNFHEGAYLWKLTRSKATGSKNNTPIRL